MKDSRIVHLPNTTFIVRSHRKFPWNYEYLSSYEKLEHHLNFSLQTKNIGQKMLISVIHFDIDPVKDNLYIMHKTRINVTNTSVNSFEFPLEDLSYFGVGFDVSLNHVYGAAKTNGFVMCLKCKLSIFFLTFNFHRVMRAIEIQTWVKGLQINILLFGKWNQKEVLYQEFLRYHSLDTSSRNTFILIPVSYIPNSSLDTVVYIYVYAQKFVKHFKNNYTQVSLLFCVRFINTQYYNIKPRKENIIMTTYS